LASLLHDWRRLTTKKSSHHAEKLPESHHPRTLALTIGMASAMLILLWVQNELSFDGFHEKADRIYQMYSRDESNGKIDVWGNTPALLAPEIKQTYGEVENAVRFRNVFFLTTVADNHFNLRGAFADPDFLTMFNFPLKRGDHH
jgi:hypothetical protein